MHRTLAASLALPLLCATGLSAQTSATLPRVLELPASTRAMALGDSYMMNAGHADAIFYHPALLTGAQGFGLDYQRWGTASSATTASAAMGWFGGGVGIGLQTLQLGSASSTVGGLPGGQDGLFTLGSTAVSERVASVGYARALLGLDVGVITKLVEERFGTARDATLLFDLGVSTDVGSLTAALTYQNIGEDLRLGAVDGARPDRLSFGVGAYGQQLGILDFGVTGSVAYVGDEVIPGAGVEIGYWPIRGRTFVGRVGVRRVPVGEANPLSFGAAYWGDNIVLEWAFQPVDDVPGASATHRFGVRWR